MKTILKLECPYCGAPLEYEEGREQMFCQYCGKKILLVDENTYNINHTVRHIDEAEIKNAEVRQSVELKKMEMIEERHRAKEKAKKTKVLLTVVLVIFTVVFIGVGFGRESFGMLMPGLVCCYVLMFMWANSNEEDDNYDYDLGMIKIPQSVSNYENKNYENIKSQFKSAGFKNIDCVPLHDLTFGLLTKPGTVESITINGQPISSYKKKYMPDAAVVISYHSK